MFPPFSIFQVDAIFNSVKNLIFIQYPQKRTTKLQSYLNEKKLIKDVTSNVRLEAKQYLKAFTETKHF